MVKWTRKIVVFIVGVSVVIVGIAMIVLPGPAMVVIPAGLAILAVEFAWARHALNKVKEKANDVKKGVTSMFKKGQAS